MSIKVKALEWTQYPDGGLQAIGAKMERFRVHPNGRSWYLGQDYMGEGGKDAAQAWFNAAILSVLEPSTDMQEANDAWEIDRSTASPILMYEKCSVIQDEQALFVMSLIRSAQGTKP